MSEELVDLLRLFAVIVPMGALITMMVYMKATAVGSALDDVRRAVLWVWAAIFGSTLLLIAGRAITGEPMIEIDLPSRSVHFGDISVMPVAVIAACLIAVVFLWATAYGQLRRVTADQPHSPGGQEEQIDGVD